MRSRYLVSAIAGVLICSMAPGIPALAGQGAPGRPSPFDYSGVTLRPCILNASTPSVPATKDTHLYVKNNSSVSINVYHADTNGKRQFGRSVAPGNTSFTHKTSYGSLFEITTANDGCLTMFSIDSTTHYAEITYY